MNENVFARMMILLWCVLGAGCIPTMPSPPADADVKAQFHQIKATALEPQIQSASNACMWRLEALVRRARSQRDWSNAAAIVGATGGVTSGTFSAALDDEGAQKATAIAAGGFAVVAAGAKLLGDPNDELKRYAVAYAHYQRAARISDRLAIGVDVPEVPDEPIRLLIAPAQPPSKEQLRWNALVVEMLDELRLCASENGDGGVKR